MCSVVFSNRFLANQLSSWSYLRLKSAKQKTDLGLAPNYSSQAISKSINNTSVTEYKGSVLI